MEAINPEVDMEGVVLHPQVMCGYCMTLMHQVDSELYRCHKCGQVFFERG